MLSKIRRFKVSPLLALVIAVFAVALLSPMAIAGEIEPLKERVLLPILLKSPIPGAEGSRWTSELQLVNRGDSPVRLRGAEVSNIDGCLITCAPGEYLTLRTGVVYFARHHYQHPEFPPAALLIVEEGSIAEVTIALRIQDLSRQALTWGTEIPVIREQDAPTSTVDLLNIPVDERFRVLLRAYDFHPRVNSSLPRVKRSLIITGYSIDTGQHVNEPDPPPEIFTIERQLQAYDSDENVPGYFELNLDEMMAAYPEVERLNLRIEPIAETFPVPYGPTGEPFPYWAFVSVTNNATQHVTIVTPD